MKNQVLLVGGYGVVGHQLAKIIRQEHPDLPLILGGRTLAAAQRAAAELGNANGLKIDIADPDPLAAATSGIRAVVAVANDPHCTLMRSAIARGVPLIDITKWTEKLHEAVLLASVLDLRSPAVLSSSWMAGVSAILAKHSTAKLAVVDAIDTAVLFALEDKAGPNSVEYADRLGMPFRVMSEGEWRRVKPMSDPEEVSFPGGYTGKAFRFDEPSQETLALYTGAANVSSRITYDDARTTRTMAFLVGSGIWGLISGSAFTKLRHSMIYNPGDGAPHEIVISVRGRAADGTPAAFRTTIVDPLGQTHLTALGAYVQLRHTLGLSGKEERTPGIYLPENTSDIADIEAVLSRHGVGISMSSAAAEVGLR